MSNEPKKAITSKNTTKSVENTGGNTDKASQADAKNKQETAVSGADTPGKQLVRAREKLGLTQQQVADRLHLRLNSVMAVEQDELEPGVSVTFNKGYVRLYGKLVQLDVQTLLDAYDKIHVQDSQPAKLQSFSRRVTREASDQRWNMVTIVVILLVVGSVIGWWVQQSESFSESQDFVSDTIDSLFSEEQNQSEGQNDQADDTTDLDPQSNVSDATVDTAVQTLDTGPQISEDEATTLNNVATTNDNKDSVADLAENTTTDDLSLQSAQLTQNTETNTDTENNLPEKATDQDTLVIEKSAETNELVASIGGTNTTINAQGYTINSDGTVDVVFTFREDCWVSVKDANDETMAIGIKAKGRVMAVSGLPPISVILGVPQHVDINFAGQEYDMSIHPGTRSANFLLSVESE